MVILLLILQAIGLYILINLPIVLIVGVAYFLIPSQFTLMTMGGFAALYAIGMFMYFVGIYRLCILGLGTKSIISYDDIDTSSDNVLELIAVLERLGFKHLGNEIVYKVFSKEKHPFLVYLNETGHVVAYVQIGKGSEASISYSTMWKGGQRVTTDSNPNGFIIHKPNFRHTTVKNGAEASYHYHIEQVKEMRETADKSLKIESLEELLNLSRGHFADTALLFSYEAITKFSIPTLGFVIIPLMTVVSFLVQGAAVFNLLPEANASFPPRAAILLFVMVGSTFYVVITLVKRKISPVYLQALDTEAQEGESLLDDAVS